MRGFAPRLMLEAPEPMRQSGASIPHSNPGDLSDGARARLRGVEQGTSRHARLLDHQNPRDDAWRDRRRHRHHDLARRDHRPPGTQRLSDRNRDLRRRCWSPWFGAQIRARRFNPWLYWATIVASTTCGTTLADFADRSLGIGYPGGSLLLLACVLLSLFAWYRTLGTVDVNTIVTPKAKRRSTG